MMRKLPLLAVFACLAAPCSALALKEPTPGKKDPRVETVLYQPGEAYALHLYVGRAMTVSLPPNIWIDNVQASDTDALQQPTIYGSSIVFKAVATRLPEPLFVFGHDKDGLPRVVAFEVDVKPAPGDDSQPFSLTLIDQAAETALRAAAWRAAQERKQAATVAAALQDPPRPTNVNTDYVARGDRALVGK
jgi:type IV secretory pathway VirB9-like protein